MKYILLPPFPMYPAGDSHLLNSSETGTVTPRRNYRFCVRVAEPVFPPNALSLLTQKAVLRRVKCNTKE